MAFLDFLFGKKKHSNPTSQWIRDPSRQPTFDLKAQTLDGVSLGTSYMPLDYLGPGKVSAEGLGFPDSQLVLGIENELLTDFTILFPTSKQTISFTLGDSSVEPAQLASEEGITALIGPPFFRDEDDDEILVFYEFGSTEWQIEFTIDGQTRRWLVVSPPLLADPDQRKAYGVNQPWPFP